MAVVKELLLGLKELIYPKTCLACKKKISGACIDELICFDCWGKIKKNAPPFCRRCGRQLEGASIPKGICVECIRRSPAFDRAFSPCVYDGTLKELIHEFKYNGKDYLCRPLARLLIGFIREYALPMDTIDFIVPVPLDAGRLREREFNQAALLGREIGLAYHKDLMERVLVRTHATRPQADLNGAARLTNVRGAFTLRNGSSVKGANFLLVDDVLTTGATASEAAGTLKKGGAHIVFVLTLAH